MTVATNAPVESHSGSDGFGSKGYRSYVLGSLLMVYIFNFIDRAILAILNDPIKETLRLEDWQMGLLGGLAFALLYVTLGIPIARVSERVSRKWIILSSLCLWSIMTVLCGFATSFLMLFVLRICVGIGEAGCTPPAQSMIADYFKPSSRATAVSIYALGVPIGAMIAGLAGGPINDYVTGENVYNVLQDWGWTGIADMYDWRSLEGWRIAFIAVGLPGLLFALILAFTMKEPPRGYTDPPEAVKQEAAGFGEVLRILIRKPTFFHIVTGAAIASFAGYGMGHFIPSYFKRIHGMSLTEAAFYYSLILGLSGATGVFLSGYLADKLSKKYPTALSLLPVFGMGISVPLYAFGYLQDNLWLTMPPLMAAALLHYFYLGPMYAVFGGVVDSRMRATAVAIGLFFVNLVGLAFGPTVSGATSTFIKSRILGGGEDGLTLAACKLTDTLTEAQQLACSSADGKGLQWTLVIFSCLYLWAAAHYLFAGKTLRRDMIAMEE